MVSGRHDEASAQLLGNLPSSLGASPDRHDIIAFGEQRSIDESVDLLGDQSLERSLDHHFDRSAHLQGFAQMPEEAN